MKKKKKTYFCFLILFPLLFTVLFSIFLPSFIPFYLFYFPPNFPFLHRLRYFLPSLVFLLFSSGSTFSSYFFFCSYLMVWNGYIGSHISRTRGKINSTFLLRHFSRHITIVNSAESILLTRRQESDAPMFVNVNLNLFRTLNYFVTCTSHFVTYTSHFVTCRAILSHVRAILSHVRTILSHVRTILSHVRAICRM